VILKPGSRGFTLLECALAAAILAAFLPVAYAITAKSFHSWVRIRDESLGREAAQIFLERLEGDLDNALPLKLAPFEGRPDFVSFPVFDRVSQGVVQVTYRKIQPQGDWVREANSWVSEPGGRTEIRAVRGIQEIDFSFSARSRSGWVDRWMSGTDLPRAVRVRVVLKKSPVSFERTLRLLAGSSS
jgi:prepilin-type N-terminal cleavage/methylation domain-containing protein